ncbi:hypothetical protein SALBM217S_09956 [Streptomyces griseoloalbus]
MDLVRSLDDTPVPTDFGYEFTGQDLAGAIAQGLYTKEMWPVLQRALAQLTEEGDTSGVEALASGGMSPAPAPPPADERPAGKPPAGKPRDDEPLADEEDVPLDNLPAALMAVNCADDPDRPDEERLIRICPACAPRTRRPRRCSGRTGGTGGAVPRPPEGDRLHPGEGQGPRHPEDAAGRHPRRPGHPVPVD